jgi:hypothetical protein
MRLCAPRLGTALLIGLLGPATGLRADGPRNLLKNPGAEEVARGDQPKDWAPIAPPGVKAKLGRATDRAHDGKASLTIAVEDDRGFAQWVQRVEGAPRDTPLTFSAWVKIEGDASVNLVVQAFARGRDEPLAIAGSPRVAGERDWSPLRCDPITIPAGASMVIVRAPAGGRGRVWFDDLALTAGDVAASGDELAKVAPGRIVRAVPIARDCMVLKYLPDWDHGDVDNIALGNQGGGARTLLRWPELAAKDLGGDGRRFFVALYAREATLEGPTRVQIHEVLADWPERTSWARRPRVAEAPAATAEVAPGLGWKLFDVTPIVRAPAKGKPGRGVLLRFADEDRPPQEVCNLAFVSREGAGEWAGRRPVLLIVEPGE